METVQSSVHCPESTLQVSHRPTERVHKKGCMVQTLKQVTYRQSGAQNSMKNEGAMTE